MSGAVLSARGVGVTLAGRTCLEAATIDLVPGRVDVLLGRSGAGKTTLLRVLAGEMAPHAGEVRLEGRELVPEPGAAFPDIGYAMQRSERQFFAPSVREEVAFALERLSFSAEAVTARVCEVLAAVGLEPARDLSRPPWALSRGRQRLVALASVLAFRPRVVLLDEPMAGLDPGASAAVAATIARVAAGGAAVLVASHAPDALPVSGGTWLLSEGRLVAIDLRASADRAALEAAGVGLPRAWSFLAARMSRFWIDDGWREPLEAAASRLSRFESGSWPGGGGRIKPGRNRGRTTEAGGGGGVDGPPCRGYNPDGF